MRRAGESDEEATTGSQQEIHRAGCSHSANEPTWSQRCSRASPADSRMGPRRLLRLLRHHHRRPRRLGRSQRRLPRVIGFGSNARSWLLAAKLACRSAEAVNSASTSQSASIGRFSTAAGTALAASRSGISCATKVPASRASLRRVSAPTPSVADATTAAAVAISATTSPGAAATPGLRPRQRLRRGGAEFAAPPRGVPRCFRALRPLSQRGHLSAAHGPLDGRPPRATRFQRRVRAAARGRAEAGGARAVPAPPHRPTTLSRPTARIPRRRRLVMGRASLLWVPAVAARDGGGERAGGALPVMKQGGDYAVAMRLTRRPRQRPSSTSKKPILRRSGTASAQRPTAWRAVGAACPIRLLRAEAAPERPRPRERQLLLRAVGGRHRLIEVSVEIDTVYTSGKASFEGRQALTRRRGEDGDVARRPEGGRGAHRAVGAHRRAPLFVLARRPAAAVVD